MRDVTKPILERTHNNVTEHLLRTAGGDDVLVRWRTRNPTKAELLVDDDSDCVGALLTAAEIDAVITHLQAARAALSLPDTGKDVTG